MTTNAWRAQKLVALFTFLQDLPGSCAIKTEQRSPQVMYQLQAEFFPSKSSLKYQEWEGLGAGAT